MSGVHPLLLSPDIFPGHEEPVGKDGSAGYVGAAAPDDMVDTCVSVCPVTEPRVTELRGKRMFRWTGLI